MLIKKYVWFSKWITIIVMILLASCSSPLIENEKNQQDAEDIGTQQGIEENIDFCISPHKLNCEEYVIPVKLAPDATEVYQVVGTLCWRNTLKNKTVQVVLSGGSYGPVYWDFTLHPNQYSYVRTATLRGYATFNLFRIGIGKSDHPPGADVTIASNAYVVHQVIEKLRTGNIGSVAFKRVMIVGHSIGSAISIKTAVEYPKDLDGIVLTGFIHSIDPAFLEESMNAFYPAEMDPRFAEKPWVDGYLTTVPGKRENLFYYSPTADPNVIEFDEATKETVTMGEMENAADFFLSSISLNINVPVMLIVGEKDIVYSGEKIDLSDYDAVMEYEAAFFSPKAQLKLVIVPETGHDLNLHKTAQFSYKAILDWSDQMMKHRRHKRK